MCEMGRGLTSWRFILGARSSTLMQPGSLHPMAGLPQVVVIRAKTMVILSHRYINHGRGTLANARPHPPPLFVKGKPRVAFLAIRQILPGEEILWDYGADLQSCIPQWMKVKPLVPPHPKTLRPPPPQENISSPTQPQQPPPRQRKNRKFSVRLERLKIWKTVCNVYD